MIEQMKLAKDTLQEAERQGAVVIMVTVDVLQYLIGEVERKDKELKYSEQVWREELERMKKSKILHDWKSGQRNLILSTENEQIRGQLNRAAKALKTIQQHPHMVPSAICRLIDPVLSSLSQGTEEGT